MVYHCGAPGPGHHRAHLVGDMPFGSYQASADEAVKNAMRLVAEGGMEAVKLEGGAEYCEVMSASCARHSGDGAHRAHSAVGAQDGRLRGPGPRRGEGDAASSVDARALKRRAAIRSSSKPSRPSWGRRSPAAWAFPPSGSAPGWNATARCWWFTTCSDEPGVLAEVREEVCEPGRR